MKRWLFAVLAALLLIAAAIPGMGENSYIDIKAREVYLNKYTDVLYCRFENSDRYCLIRADGTKITDEIYNDIRVISGSEFFSVEVDSEDGIHSKGVIDSRGNVIVPPQYAKAEAVSDRWAYGVTWTPSDADNYDYTSTNWDSGEKSFYQVKNVDLYFRGRLVGTLGRADFDTGWAPAAYGDYICVVARSQEKKFYDPSMTLAPANTDSYGEYTTTYNGRSSRYIHNGSGQAAFTEGCTLTPEEVEQSIVYENGRFLDLQGKEAFKAPQNYDYTGKFSGGYAVVTVNGKKGLINDNGEEIIPTEYDNIGNYEDHPLEFGVISAVKDGKFGFLDARGNVTCDFVYSSDIVQNYGPLAKIQNLDGTVIVLSGLVGELPEHYPEVEMSLSGGRAFRAQNADGDWCLIDLNGETLIPYGEVDSIDCNRTAAVACGRLGYGTYRIYTFTHDDAAPAGTETKDIAAEEKDIAVKTEDTAAVTEEKIAPDDQSTWDCPGCGKTVDVTFRFCPYCGYENQLPEPAQGSEEWLCTTCVKYVNAEFAFCPVCGGSRETNGLKEGEWFCGDCKKVNRGGFCGRCGKSREEVAVKPSMPEPTPKPTPEPEHVLELRSMKNAQAGDYVTYGRYPQTAEGTDSTPIEWQVLERSGDTVTLISRFGLDCRQYHATNKNITWETCDIRAWLNDEFYSVAFTEDEQKAIKLTHLKNPNNPTKYNTPGGCDTDDKVFLLSLEEVLKYYRVSGTAKTAGVQEVSEKLIAAPTAYAAKRGAETYTLTSDEIEKIRKEHGIRYSSNIAGTQACRWWLRSPGVQPILASCVQGSGSVDEWGKYLKSDGGVVRPVIVLELPQ